MDLPDPSGQTVRDWFVRDARFANVWLEDVAITGMVQRLTINGVDVAPFVEGELDRRHPERVQVRNARSASELRAAWTTIRSLWDVTMDRAEQLPEQARFVRVDGEWSFAETLRHLVFATDAWAGRTVLDQERPYHRLGLSHTEYPREDALALGLQLDASPSWADVLTARRDRQGQIDGVMVELTDADLGRMCPRSPAPGYPDEHPTVSQCLHVVLSEECEHRRYAERDLDELMSRQEDGSRVDA
jgi:hypothetical protein